MKILDSFAFNVILLILSAFAAFIGLAVGIAGVWLGWVALVVGIGSAAFFFIETVKSKSKC